MPAPIKKEKAKNKSLKKHNKSLKKLIKSKSKPKPRGKVVMGKKAKTKKG